MSIDEPVNQSVNSSNNKLPVSNNKSYDTIQKYNKTLGTTQKSINTKRNTSVRKNAPSKYALFIKKSCKSFNVSWLNAEIDYLLSTLNDYDFRHDFSMTNKEIPELKEVLKIMMYNDFKSALSSYNAGTMIYVTFFSGSHHLIFYNYCEWEKKSREYKQMSGVKRIHIEYNKKRHFTFK